MKPKLIAAMMISAFMSLPEANAALVDVSSGGHDAFAASPAADSHFSSAKTDVRKKAEIEDATRGDTGYYYVRRETASDHSSEHEVEFGPRHRESWKLDEAEREAELPVLIPLPAAAWLFGSGMLFLAGVARRRKM